MRKDLLEPLGRKVFEKEDPGDDFVLPLEVFDDFLHIGESNEIERVEELLGEDPIASENAGEERALDPELDSSGGRLFEY